MRTRMRTGAACHARKTRARAPHCIPTRARTLPALPANSLKCAPCDEGYCGDHCNQCCPNYYSECPPSFARRSRNVCAPPPQPVTRPPSLAPHSRSPPTASEEYSEGGTVVCVDACTAYVESMSGGRRRLSYDADTGTYERTLNPFSEAGMSGQQARSLQVCYGHGICKNIQQPGTRGRALAYAKTPVFGTDLEVLPARAPASLSSPQSLPHHSPLPHGHTPLASQLL